MRIKLYVPNKKKISYIAQRSAFLNNAQTAANNLELNKSLF